VECRHGASALRQWRKDPTSSPACVYLVTIVLAQCSPESRNRRAVLGASCSATAVRSRPPGTHKRLERSAVESRNRALKVGWHSSPPAALAECYAGRGMCR
jgi:hypothetical protein